jgi:hypothetical protein
MYPRWQTIDFRRSAEQLEVPVYIFTGKHELAARRDLALAWFKRLRAPGKHLYDYRDAGHATAFEHFRDLRRILVEDVVPATYSNGTPARAIRSGPAGRFRSRETPVEPTTRFPQVAQRRS